MYGIVNQAIKGLITDKYGADSWEDVRDFSGVDESNFFISNSQYPDKITFELVVAASEVLKEPVEDILYGLGEYWILKTGREKYGTLLAAGGDSLKTFLINLPHFHNRVMLIYPKAQAPVFRIELINERSALLHYISQRSGLNSFLIGLINGIATMFDENIEIELVDTEESNNNHSVFFLKW